MGVFAWHTSEVLWFDPSWNCICSWTLNKRGRNHWYYRFFRYLNTILIHFNKYLNICILFYFMSLLHFSRKHGSASVSSITVTALWKPSSPTGWLPIPLPGSTSLYFASIYTIKTTAQCVVSWLQPNSSAYAWAWHHYQSIQSLLLVTDFFRSYWSCSQTGHRLPQKIESCCLYSVEASWGRCGSTGNLQNKPLWTSVFGEKVNPQFNPQLFKIITVRNDNYAYYWSKPICSEMTKIAVISVISVTNNRHTNILFNEMSISKWLVL